MATATQAALINVALVVRLDATAAVPDVVAALVVVADVVHPVAADVVLPVGRTVRLGARDVVEAVQADAMDAVVDAQTHVVGVRLAVIRHAPRHAVDARDVADVGHLAVDVMDVVDVAADVFPHAVRGVPVHAMPGVVETVLMVVEHRAHLLIRVVPDVAAAAVRHVATPAIAAQIATDVPDVVHVAGAVEAALDVWVAVLGATQHVMDAVHHVEISAGMSAMEVVQAVAFPPATTDATLDAADAPDAILNVKDVPIVAAVHVADAPDAVEVVVDAVLVADASPRVAHPVVHRAAHIAKDAHLVAAVVVLDAEAARPAAHRTARPHAVRLANRHASAHRLQAYLHSETI